MNFIFLFKMYAMQLNTVSSPQLLFPSENTFNPLSANPTKWSNRLKQLVGN